MEAFVAVHQERLLRLAGLVCGDVASAEDIVQMALERAWRSRRAISADDRLRPWLDRIVVREAARERRSRLTWLGRLIRPPTVMEIDASGGDLVDVSAGRFPERSAIRLAFEGLSAPQRAVIVLSHSGYSVDEAAALLGVPRDTVRSRLRTAREHLRHRPSGGQVMDRHISDEQLDRAIDSFLADRGDEIMAAARSIHRAAAIGMPRAVPARRLAVASMAVLLVALLAAAGVFVGSQVLRLAPTTPSPLGGFTPAGTLDEPLESGYFTATALPDGRVLIVGGCASCTTAQLWDPATMTFSPAGSLPEGRDGHSATLLPDGRVLVLGGYVPPDKSGTHPSVPAELWDPRTLSFSPAGPHGDFDLYRPPTATVLPDGRVLILEDTTTGKAGTFELWDPGDGTFHQAGTLPDGFADVVVGLGDGRVLIVGGPSDGRQQSSRGLGSPDTVLQLGGIARPGGGHRWGRDTVGGRSCADLGWVRIRRQHSALHRVRRGVGPGHRGIQPCRDHVCIARRAHGDSAAGWTCARRRRPIRTLGA